MQKNDEKWWELMELFLVGISNIFKFFPTLQKYKAFRMIINQKLPYKANKNQNLIQWKIIKSIKILQYFSGRIVKGKYCRKMRQNDGNWWNCFRSVYRIFSDFFEVYKSIKPLEWFSIKNYCVKRIKIKISYNEKS